jgi:hypothetical protein
MTNDEANDEVSSNANDEILDLGVAIASHASFPIGRSFMPA